MKTQQDKTPKRAPNLERPFPWRCRQCGKQEVILATTEYQAEVRHDGRLHTFTMPNLELPVCQDCGARVFTEAVDAQVNNALRAHLKLLTPAQIREGINRVGLSQKEIASRLGIAEATLSRWLNETQIQSRAMDNFLRAYFALPQLRAVLCQDTEALGLKDFEDPGMADSSAVGVSFEDHPSSSTYLISQNCGEITHREE